jgi:Pentapeptide repeats (8 copies)
VRGGAVRLRSRLGKRAGEVEHSGNRRDIRRGIRPHRGSDRSVPNAAKAQRGLTTDSRTRRAASKRSCTTEIFEVVGQLLSKPSEADYLSPILRAQTLTLLEALGPGYKRILLQFLYELSLLGPEKPGLSLQGANLREANLKEADLSRAFLQVITKEDSLKRRSINETVGNDATTLPDHLQRPAHWRGGLEGRVRRELR